MAEPEANEAQTPQAHSARAHHPFSPSSLQYREACSFFENPQSTGESSEEVWRIYPENRNYEVSSLGRVRNVGTRCFMKPSPCKSYFKVWVGQGEGFRGRSEWLHIVVARTFLGECPRGREVSHLNGNGKDNRRRNLKYETRKENNARKKEHGTFKGPPRLRGEKHPGAKLVAEEVTFIRESNAPKQVLARTFGVSRRTISHIINRETWTEV